MSYAYFQNLAAWNTYHDAACAANGIPRPGYRADDNDTVMLDAAWTDAWVTPIQFKAQGNVTTWVANVPDADVVTYHLSPTIPNSAVVLNADGTLSVTVGGRTYIAEPLTMTYRKAKPPTWTDPHDGTVYVVAP